MAQPSIVRTGPLLLLCAGIALAQQTPAAPAFEVATVRPAAPIEPSRFKQGKFRIGMQIDGARADIRFMSLADLIRTAYDVKPWQISGPDWLKTERFDIVAKLPDGATKNQVPSMLKTLLAERFKLAAHTENREHPVYALVVGRNGPKLEPAAPVAAPAAPDSAATKDGAAIETPDGTVQVKRNADGRGATVTTPKGGIANVSMGKDGLFHMEESKLTMAEFADMLSRFVDRPVIDETGLEGDYRLSIDLSIQDMMRLAASQGFFAPGMAPGAFGGQVGASAADAASDPGGNSVFAAVQRLGLRLEPKKEPLETIVVDHVEKTPLEN